MTNPYNPPHSSSVGSPSVSHKFPVMSYVLAVYGIAFGLMHFPQFIVSPTALSLNIWLLGFVPSAYLILAAMVAVFFERSEPSRKLIFVPLFLAPLLIVTGIILYFIHPSIPRLLAGKLSLSQMVYAVIVLSFCPTAWYYFCRSTVRSWQLLKNFNKR